MASQSVLRSDDVWMFSSTGNAGWGLRNIVLDNWTSSQGDNTSFIAVFSDCFNTSLSVLIAGRY